MLRRNLKSNIKLISVMDATKKICFSCNNCQKKGVMPFKDVGLVPHGSWQLGCMHKVVIPGVGTVSSKEWCDILFNYFSYVNIRQRMLTEEEKNTYRFMHNLKIVFLKGCDSTLWIRTPDCKEDYKIGKKHIISIVMCIRFIQR